VIFSKRNRRRNLVRFVSPQTKNMAKKVIFGMLHSILLTACISITAGSKSRPAQQDFVTATLQLTTTRWLPVTATALHAVTAPTTETVAPRNCANAAILLRDVTIPDDTQVTAGETFIKTWEFQNTGTCPWVGHTMRFSAGESLNAPLFAPVADTPPGGNVQVSVELTAPSMGGKYTAYFTLHDAAGNAIPIGSETSFWVKVLVGDVILTQNPTAPLVYTRPNPHCTYSQNAGYVSEIISLINAERADAGLSTLTLDTEIGAFAQSHAEAMAFNNFLSHDGINASFGERIMGYNIAHPGGQIFGEILAIGTPQNAMDQWRRDEHWDYVLGNFTKIGVGYAYNSCSDFAGYFTVDFGS
jgi:uncharacterized protein YkwD